ncbi:MAG: hypothetical protein JXA11_16490 [Phycisphaerae bacterium]|nr:hypothetical protein [Phycisphaerae bacterium]
MKNESTLLSPVVLSRLRSLRLALRGRLLLEGLARLLLVVTICLFASLGLDYSLHLDKPLRITILSICGLCIFYTLWRRFIKPLVTPMTPRSLALLIERKFPQLDDRLMTALEPAGDETVSRAMLMETARQADQIARTLPVRNIVETRRLGYVACLAIILGGLLVGFAIYQPGVMRLWYRRNLLLANVDWPQRTYLSVYYVDNAGTLRPLLESDSNGVILQRRETAEVLRGEALEVLVAAPEGVVAPETVTLHVRYPSVGDTEEKLTPLSLEQAKVYHDMKMHEGETPSLRAGRMPATRAYTWYRKRFSGVNEAFRFHAVGGDDRRDARRPHKVSLVEAPLLAEVQFTVTSPAYMRQAQPTVLAGSRGVLPIPHGSTVHVTATATKSIASARMLLDDGDAITMAVMEESGAPPRRLTGVVKPEGKNVSATRTLRFELRDRDGYTSRRPETYVLQILPDLPPTVNLQVCGVRNVVCPTARIPLLLEAKDDHGLASVRAVWRADDPALKTPTTAPTYQPVDKSAPVSPDDPRRHDVKPMLDLLPHKLPPGMKLTVRAEAVDTLPESLQGPNTTAGSELTFDIIPREKLLSQLIGLQKEARMELFQAMGQQEFARGRCSSAAGDLAAGTIQPAILKKLADAGARQRQVMNEATKVADSMASVATEMELNRLGRPEEHAALRDNVVSPLRKLLQVMRTVSADLDAARKLSDAPRLARRAREIAKQQKDVYDAMETILANMSKLENRLELARQLEGLLKMSVELEAILRQRVEREIEDIFEDEEKANQP